MTSSAEPGSVTSLSSLPKVTRFGNASTCAVLSDQSLQCWSGSNGAPTAVPDVTKATQAAGESAFGYALGSDGIVRRWGQDPTPQPVANLAASIRIIKGGAHYCSIAAGGALWCWGTQGMFDQLIEYGSTPIQVSGLGTVVDAAASLWETCVVQGDHVVKCWGSAVGQSDWSASPVTITGLPQN
jgi:hypothetical protein